MGEGRGRVRRSVTSSLGAAIFMLLLGTACQAGSSAGDVSITGAGQHRPASTARIHITPADGRESAPTTSGISVTVSQGTLKGVKVRTTGDPVSGDLNAGRTVWHSRWTLDTDTSYTVVARAVDMNGEPASARSSFRTFTPSRTFRTQIFEGYRSVYGVGMPVILQFSEPITNKRGIERSLQLWSSKPVVGSWYWEGDQTLYFRPRAYWPTHTKVRFVGHLNGIEGAPGVYGVHTLTQTFLIGRSLIAVADTQTHHVQIYLDKKLFGDWPMSSGRPGDDTPNGTYLTIEKSNPELMVGPGYRIEVPWSVRFTWSGDFMHDAFWSVNEQGFQNVSHGCVNLSPANAETYYKLAVPGDPVTITGSPKGGTMGNGWTVWFLSWRDLVKGSLFHQAVKVGPNGSRLVSPGSLQPSHAKVPLGAPSPGNSEAS
jgi:lipoprotein-anchoring transpeptidase ErfK/SrfK